MRGVAYELEGHNLKLEQEYQFPASPRTLRRMLALYKLSPNRIRRAAGGIENETFVVEGSDQQYVLRVYRQYKKTPDEIYQELDFMHFLAANGLAVPEVIKNTKGRFLTEVTIDGVRWQGILMNLMPGVHPESFTPRLLGDMASMQASLHLLGREYAETSLQLRNMLRRAAAGPAKRLALSLGDLARAGVRSLLPKGYSHFDFTPNNLLVKQRRISAILDFDDMTYGPLANCLAVTLNRLPQGLQTPANLECYLNAYEAVRPLGRFERFYLWAIFSYKQFLRRLLRFAT